MRHAVKAHKRRTKSGKVTTVRGHTKGTLPFKKADLNGTVYRCNKCGKIFHNMKELREHLFVKHGIVYKEPLTKRLVKKAVRKYKERRQRKREEKMRRPGKSIIVT